MTAAEHLATYGFTKQQAHDFIYAHLDDPVFIFQVASQYGVTNAMLGDIAGGYSAAEVRGFFSAHGIDARPLDPAPLAFFPQELGPLAGLIALDTYGGALSVASLSARVIAATNAADYANTFDATRYAGSEDGVFTPTELGVSQLGTLPATSDTMQSLFFGTIVKCLKSVDYLEAYEIGAYVDSHQAALLAGDDAAVSLLVTMMIGAFGDGISFVPAAFSNDEVADVAVSAGTLLVQMVGAGASPELFGSLLGAIST